MKPKILITGKNSRIVENIADHMEADQGYRVRKCPADKYDIQDEIREIEPHIAIICTFDEDTESIKEYDVLMECNHFAGLPVIVVANKEDVNEFKSKTRLHEMYFLPRPVSIVALYNKLFEIERELGLDYEEEEEEKEPEEPEYRRYRDDEPRIKRKHILVVDDEFEQLAQMREFLREFYDVTCIRTGPEALEYIENHHIDLMLLDYMMSKMSGPEVLYQMRTKRAYANIPVIFLTGMTDKETIVKTLVELRPQGYVLKPVRKSDLIARIIDVLG